MTRKRLFMLAGAALAPALVLAAAAQEQPLDPRIAAYDKGPDKINVSKYPKDLQTSYKLFLLKCGKCHTPARAINCDYVLEDEWERYVKRMMRRAGSFISTDEGKEIYRFLVHDAKSRKKELYDRKLKEADRPSSSR